MKKLIDVFKSIWETEITTLIISAIEEFEESSTSYWFYIMKKLKRKNKKRNPQY